MLSPNRQIAESFATDVSPPTKGVLQPARVLFSPITKQTHFLGSFLRDARDAHVHSYWRRNSVPYALRAAWRRRSSCQAL